MSKRKKKLHVRKYQPWYHKKAAIAQAMEDALTVTEPPPSQRSIGDDVSLRTGTATAASTSGGRLMLDSVSAATADRLIATLEERSVRVKEGMKRWHKAVRQSDSRQAGRSRRRTTKG